ncbi:hypothetical protein HWV62_44371 [Athelia sp. TMB]|nr:hypothetical protein HWV62_44371 [Athelia sp. TMB]
MADRRKSIAVTSAAASDVPAKRKRRAHSIAPGEYISPSKARRPIAPRKSILKPANQPLEDEDEDPSSSQESTTTRTFAPRPSLAAARRVSFAQHSYVREYYKDQAKSSSPAHPPAAPSDENAYPGGGKRRRSSMRKSIAFSEGESMEMDLDDTAPGPSAFRVALDSEAQEDELEEDGDEMDMTDDLPAQILARRSLSLGPATPRRPLAPVAHIPIPPTPPHLAPSSDDLPYDDELDDAAGEGQSFLSEATTTSAGSNTSTGPLEYTIPLVKPPAPPTDAWLALRSVTHSGDQPYSDPLSDDYEGGGGGDMELTDALERLRAAAVANGEDSFGSTEDSFSDDMGEGAGDAGDHTLNLTEHRRMSLAAGSEGEETMALTRVISAGGSILHEELEFEDDGEADMAMTGVVPRHGEEEGVEGDGEEDMALTRVVPAPAPVFSAPPPAQQQQQPNLAAPEPFNFTFAPPKSPVRGKSPAKTAPKSPAKASKIPTPVFSVFSAPPRSPAPVSPKKRPAQEAPEGRPSPAKKVALASPTKSRPTAAPVPSKSPAKASPAKPSTAKPALAGRRPSGYFAQRKSIGGAGTGAGMSGLRARMSVGGAALAGKGIDVGAEKARAAREREQREEEARAQTEKESVPTAPHEEEVEPPAATHEEEIVSTIAPEEIVPMVHEQPEHEEDAEEQDEDMEMETVNPAAQWRDAHGASEYTPEDSTPPISIEQFFEMTGIRFMDDLTAPRRKSLAPPSRRRSSSAQDDDLALASYVVALAIDVPQLELYTYVARDLEAWVARSRAIFAEAEAEAARATPELFREFVGAPEDGQAELLHQLKLIKANTQASARGEWYDWKLQWVEQLFGKADKAFADLTADAKTLEGINGQAQTLVPQLREEYEQVMRELEAEKACVAEIEGCDQKYLNELKAEIAVQDAQLEAFEADVVEGNAKLERLKEKLSELDAEKQETLVAIDRAERLVHIQKNSTNAEVFRLKDELESLQNLHLWHAVKIQSDLLELTYASIYCVSIPCKKFAPDVEGVEIQRLEKVSSKVKDAFPALTDLMLRMAKQTLLQDESILTTRQIVQRLSDYWSSCTQLRGQLRLLAAKYPLEVTVTRAENGTSGFKATATVIFRNLKAKALVSFVLDFKTFASWPMSVGATGCEVDVVYGPVQ